MIKGLAIFVFLGVFANGAYALNCDLPHFAFGVNQESVKITYNLDVLDVATTGEAVITARGNDVCKEMPGTTIANFVFIDNQFVQVNFVNKNSKAQPLYKIAVRVFGEQDNKDKVKLPKGLTKKQNIAVWSKDNEYSIVYTLANIGNEEVEKLIITSDKHQKLFDKVNLTKTKEADDYLRENNLGIYSTGKTTNKNETKGLKQEYNNKDNKFKELKENENSRGFHYEQ